MEYMREIKKLNELYRRRDPEAIKKVEALGQILEATTVERGLSIWSNKFLVQPKETSEDSVLFTESSSKDVDYDSIEGTKVHIEHDEELGVVSLVVLESDEMATTKFRLSGVTPLANLAGRLRDVTGDIREGSFSPYTARTLQGFFENVRNLPAISNGGQRLEWLAGVIGESERLSLVLETSLSESGHWELPDTLSRQIDSDLAFILDELTPFLECAQLREDEKAGAEILDLLESMGRKYLQIFDFKLSAKMNADTEETKTP